MYFTDQKFLNDFLYKIKFTIYERRYNNNYIVITENQYFL